MSERGQTRMELIEAFLPHSPHPAALGISIEELEADHAILAMPYKPELATLGDVVNGGAISTLMDTAATAAAWATDDIPESPAGSTVSLSVNFTSAARGTGLRADARVLRRSARLSSIEVHARDDDGRLVAHGVATYSLR